VRQDVERIVDRLRDARSRSWLQVIDDALRLHLDL
jgi:hypothetical protein